MYQLYAFPTQNNKKVVYVLEELGLDYKLNIVDLFKGEHKTEEFLKMNPAGKVPVLQHNDDYLFESGAICRYLADVENSPLFPTDKLKRAKVDQWMEYFTNHLGHSLNQVFFEKIIKIKVNLGAPNQERCDEALGLIKQQAAMVNDQLGIHEFIAGEELSIADFCGYAYLEQAAMCDISLSSYPHIEKWMQGIQSRPSIKTANSKLK